MVASGLCPADLLFCLPAWHCLLAPMFQSAADPDRLHGQVKWQYCRLSSLCMLILACSRARSLETHSGSDTIVTSSAPLTVAIARYLAPTAGDCWHGIKHHALESNGLLLSAHGPDGPESNFWLRQATWLYVWQPAAGLVKLIDSMTAAPLMTAPVLLPCMAIEMRHLAEHLK